MADIETDVTMHIAVWHKDGFYIFGQNKRSHFRNLICYQCSTAPLVFAFVFANIIHTKLWQKYVLCIINNTNLYKRKSIDNHAVFVVNKMITISCLYTIYVSARSNHLDYGNLRYFDIIDVHLLL